MDNDVVILGFGGHAKSIVDSIMQEGKYNIVGYTDNNDCHCAFSYLGTDERLATVYHNGVHKAVLGVGFLGNSLIRDRIVDIAKKIGFEFPIVVDPSAIIAKDVAIGEGCFIGKKAVINAGSIIGDFCIINTGSIIEHENRIGDYSHVSVGAILCGNVTIGNHSFIGAGTTVVQGQNIGSNCIIGANSTVISNIEDNVKIYGVI